MREEVCTLVRPGALGGLEEAPHRSEEVVRRARPLPAVCNILKFERSPPGAATVLDPPTSGLTMMTQPRLALLSLYTLAAALGCGGDSSGPPAVASVEVSGPASDVQVGGTLQLTATARDAKGAALTGRPVSWTSGSPSIATVTSAGVVTGVATGSSAITATIGGRTGSQTITVVPPPVATVSVTLASSTLLVGQTTTATAVTRDASNAVITGRQTSWSSINPQIASVSSGGVVTALTPGSTTIIATSETKSGSAQVTVSSGNQAQAPQITGVSPNTLVEGQAATITGTKFGATAAENSVRIAGVSASVTSVTPTSLEIVVPNMNCKPAQTLNVQVTVGGNTSVPRPQAFTPPTTLSVAQGKQQVISPPADFCLQFPASAASETYVIGVQSISESVASVTSANVVGESPAGAAATPVATIANSPVFSAAMVDPATDARGIRLAKHRAAELALFDADRAMVASKFQAARAARRAARASLSMVPVLPPTAKEGDVLNIRIPDRARNICQSSLSLAVTVKKLGARGIFLEDNANPSGGFSAANYQALSDQFDAMIYVTDAAYFGEPTDFDNNSRIAVVITKEVNKIDNLLGEVFPQNLVPQSICPSSNEGEFFYGRAPDPNGTAGTKYAVSDALADAPVIIAHELAHVIQIGRRIVYPPATDLQSTWELEGQATFAEEVNGYAATGLAPGQNLGRQIAFNNPPTQPTTWFADPFADLAVYYGFETRTTRVSGAPEQCSWLGTRSQGNSGPCLSGREPYGVSWSFLRWLSDQYGGQFPLGEKGLHQALIDNAFSGFATITSVIGQPIDALLVPWSAMLYADDRIPGVDAKLTMKSWDLVSIEQGIVEPGRIAPRSRTFGAFSDQILVRGGSTAYFVVSGTNRPATGIRVRDASDGPLPDIMRVWVVRAQ